MVVVSSSRCRSRSSLTRLTFLPPLLLARPPPPTLVDRAFGFRSGWLCLGPWAVLLDNLRPGPTLSSLEPVGCKGRKCKVLACFRLQWFRQFFGGVGQVSKAGYKTDRHRVNVARVCSIQPSIHWNLSLSPYLRPYLHTARLCHDQSELFNFASCSLLRRL